MDFPEWEQAKFRKGCHTEQNQHVGNPGTSFAF